MTRRFVPSFVIAIALVPLAQAQDRQQLLRSNPQLMAALVDIVAKPSEFTVRVRCDDKDAALGTIVEADGYIVTKFSELKGDAKVKLKDGRELAAKLISVHPDNDLALLKVEAKGLPVPDWRDSKEDAVGAWVASVGPAKEPLAVGVISVATRTITGRPGPRFLPSTNSGYLGVRMDPGEGGVKIINVDKDTPAEKAGLKVGDLVTSLDNKPMPDVETMMETLARKKPGDKVAVKLTREGKAMEIQATLGRRPSNLNRGEFQNAMGGALSERRNGFKTILQHDTILKPNECGGPLVDLDGKVLGINIARAGRTESYALPTELIRPIIAEMKAGKFPPPKVDQVKLDRIKQLEGTIKSLKDKLKDAEEELQKLKEDK